MNFFLFGIIFGVLGQLVRSLAENLAKFKPGKIIHSICKDVPSFFAFAFVAGVSAHWLTDKENNHAPEFGVSVAVWLITLVIRQIMWLGWKPMNQLLRANKFLLHNFIVWFVSTTIAGSVGLTYILLSKDTGLNEQVLLPVVIAVVAIYSIAVITYLGRLRQLLENDCITCLRSITEITCGHYADLLPNPVRSPDAFANINTEAAIGVRSVMRGLLDDSIQIVGLEDPLTNSIANDNPMPPENIRAIVRGHLKSIGEQFQTKFYAIEYVIGDEHEKAKAKDVLSREESLKIEDLDRARGRFFSRIEGEE